MPLGTETMLTSDKCSAKFMAMKRYIIQVRMFLHICGLSQQLIHKKKKKSLGPRGYILKALYRRYTH